MSETRTKNVLHVMFSWNGNQKWYAQVQSFSIISYIWLNRTECESDIETGMKRITSGLFFIWFMASPCVYAQLQGSIRDQGVASQYFLGSQDQLLMAVNVWGFVTKPGQYMIPYDTDLITLLSYAGGPREEAKITAIKVVRASETDSTDKELVIDVDVKEYLKTGDSKLVPVLKPGDTVVVSGTTFHFVSEFFDFAWRVATIVQVWAFVQYWTKRD
jgi:protein involved in polysaccharide export with SLBB domain